MAENICPISALSKFAYCPVSSGCMCTRIIHCLCTFTTMCDYLVFLCLYSVGCKHSTSTIAKYHRHIPAFVLKSSPNECFSAPITDVFIHTRFNKLVGNSHRVHKTRTLISYVQCANLFHLRALELILHSLENNSQDLR